MNTRTLLCSLALGILIVTLQYPFHLLFLSMGWARIQILAVSLAAFTATIIFTALFYRQPMSARFKLCAMLASIGTSLLLLLGYLALKGLVPQMLNEIANAAKNSPAWLLFVASLSIVLALLLQCVAQYPFIALGNTLMIKFKNYKDDHHE